MSEENQVEKSESILEQPASSSPNVPEVPTSQPYNPPFPGSHYNNSVGSRIKENLTYFKTVIGILKIVSVVLLGIAIGLIFYGFQYATLFDGHRLNDDGSTSSGPRCQHSNSSSCKLDAYFTDQLCKKEGRDEKPCVNYLLVTLPFALIATTFNCTVFCLIRRLVVRLNRNTKRYYRTDGILHLVASFLVIVSGLCIIGYFVQVTREDLCGNTNLKAEATDSVINEPNYFKPMGRAFVFTTSTGKPKQTTTTTSSSTSSSTPPSDQNELRQQSNTESDKIASVLANLTAQCPEKQRQKYYHWHILIGGIFAIITGIVYIVIAGFSKKMAGQAVDVDPVRMVMGPNGPQQRPTPPSQAQIQSTPSS